MTSKSTILLVLALFCCFFATTFSQPYPETCVIRYFSTPELELNRNYIFLEDDFVSPFVGWAWANDAQTERVTKVFTGLRAVQAGFCELCTLTVYSTTDFGGRSAFYDFRDNFEFVFPFCVKSIQLHCRPPPVEEEEEEEGNEVPGTIEYELLDPSQTNTPYLNDLKATGVSLATQFAAMDGILPEGFYTVTATNSVEQATNINNWYRFDVDVTDGQGTNAHLVFEIWDNPNFQAPEIQTYTAQVALPEIPETR